MPLRSVLQAVVSAFLCASLVAVGAPASAQDKIDKPVKILVGFAAGGTADLIARVAADKMKDSLGVPVIVENRPGAIGRITAEAVKSAPPDGTLIMVMPIGPMTVVPHVYKDIPYDPIKDFTPIAIGATFQFAIAAGPASGAKTWADFAAWAKANPGKASYATSGAGSLPHFFGVLLGRGIGVEMVHVPYKGSAAYINDLISGQVPAAIDAIADLTELHRAGRVTILASSGAKRSTVLPDVPTFEESGVMGMIVSNWFGVFAPARLPKDILAKLHKATIGAMRAPDVRARFGNLSLDITTTTPQAFEAHLKSELEKWGKVVKAAGIRAE